MWRSSSVPITQKDLSSSRSAGWSNEHSHGSGDAGASPKIGRISTERRSHFCASLQSGSCSENYAILHDLSGQTLRKHESVSLSRFPGHAGGPPVGSFTVARFENSVDDAGHFRAVKFVHEALTAI